MSSTLSILLSGVVGVTPRILFLATSDDEATIFAPGFLNQLEQTSAITLQKGDFIFIVFDNGTMQEIAIPDISPDGIITLLPVAGDINTGGPINGGLNVGAGSEVFKDVVSNLMRFRTLVAGNNITLTENADDITIDAADPGAGTITDGQNLGTGEGIFAQASGADLQFKSLIAGANITLTPTLTDITIDATGSGGGTITDGVNLGGGNHVFNSASGANLQFNTLVSGDNVTIIPTGNTLVISATPGGGGGDVTDGVNLGSGTHVFAQKSGTDLQFKTLVAGPNISLSNDSNTVTITGTGGGGGGFDYQHTQFVGKGGNDANNGLSINTPKLTIQAAITALNLGGIIYVIDNGTYTENLIFISTQNYRVEAPGATLAAGAGPHFTYSNGSEITINANVISSSFKEILNGSNGSEMILSSNKVFGNVTNPVGLVLNTIELGGNISNSGTADINALSIAGAVANSGTLNIKFDAITGNVTDTSFSSVIPKCGLFGNLITGTMSSNNSNIFGQVSRITGAHSGVKFGSFGPSLTSVPFGTQNGIFVGGGVEISNSSVKGELLNISPILNGTADYTISKEDANNVIGVYSSSLNMFINLPDYATDPDIPLGFKCYVLQVYAGSARILPMGSDIFHSSDNNKEWTQGRGAFVQIQLMVKASAGNGFQNIWAASGDLAGSAFNQYAGPNFYVSKLSGSDSEGNGAITFPYATIGAAYAAADAIISGAANIVILDDETYGENLNLTNGLINIIGPQATLIQGSADDTITAAFSGSQIQIVLKSIGNFTGFSSINCTGDNSILLQVNTIESGTVTQGGAGQMYIQAMAIDATVTCTGSGNITYITSERVGSDTPGAGTINALSNAGVSGNFTIGGALVADGLAYPVADGTIGQAIVTDGAGTLSFATVGGGGGGITWNGIAGTTQAAAVNNGYVVQNAGQTTITLPATAALGSIVAVAGLGAGGWILQANGGQTIHAGAVATSAGGNLTSANQWDQIEVVCVVADTAWAMRSAVTAGFIPA